MPTRQCLAAALLALLSLAVVGPGRGEGRFVGEDRPSHRPIKSGLEEDASPEALLNQRLESLRKLKLGQDGDILDLAKRLMQDKSFVDSVKGMKREDIERLKRRFQTQGEGGLADDPALKNFLKQSLKSTSLSATDKELIKKWAKNAPDGDDGGGNQPGGADAAAKGGGPGPAPPAPPGPDSAPPPSAETPRPSWEQALARSEGWLGRNVDRLAGRLNDWFDTPGGKRWQNRLKDLGRRALEAKALVPKNWADRTKGAVSWLPRLTEAMPAGSMPRLPGTPNVPSLGGLPAGPSLSPGSVAATGKVLLVVALLGVAVAVVWRLAGTWIAARVGGLAAGWRLGPWPVRPQAVASRGDLVRAFEYLALLVLGPVARTWNHLEVGQRLGEQPTADADRRREAAGRLAQLYEQARYAPEREPLPPAELAVARRELCYLAGVPSA